MLGIEAVDPRIDLRRVYEPTGSDVGEGLGNTFCLKGETIVPLGFGFWLEDVFCCWEYLHTMDRSPYTRDCQRERLRRSSLDCRATTRRLALTG